MSSKIVKIEGLSEQNETKFNVCFVKSEPKINENFDNMLNAFQIKLIKTIRFKVFWISFDQIKALESFDNHLFVMNSFDGQIFSYLLERNARIISPLVILYSYSSDSQMRFDSIPIKKYPIMSQCMRNLKICVSHQDIEQKKILINKIESMSGLYSEELTSEVTHLVTHSVRTKKFSMALSIGISVMSIEWINECWNSFQLQLLDANHHSIVNQFKLSIALPKHIFTKNPKFIFKGLLISVSQVDIEEQNRIKKLVETNGGVFCPNPDFENNNALLLLNEPKGNIYINALINNMTILQIKWLYDSVLSNKQLPKTDYFISKAVIKLKDSKVNQEINIRDKVQLKSQNESHSKTELDYKNFGTDDGLDWIESCQSSIGQKINQTKLHSNSGQTKRIDIKDLLDFPLKRLAVCEEMARKAIQKLKKNSQIQGSYVHRSLAERFNEKMPIVWNDRVDDGLISQRPFTALNK